MAQVLPQVDDTQLTLADNWQVGTRMQPAHTHGGQRLCAGCRQKEARYGFRGDDDEAAERPRMLCFSCFRVELNRRQAVAARLARGWNAKQVQLPLEQTLRELNRRRRRAQIAARHALDAPDSQ
jgi:hypothetical protein